MDSCIFNRISYIQRYLPGTFESLNAFQIKISNSKLDRSHERTCRENHAYNEFTFFETRSGGNTTFVAKAMVSCIRNVVFPFP